MRAERRGLATAAALGLGFALAAALAGCGGGDDEGDARGTAGPACGAILTACENTTPETADATFVVQDCLDTARTATDDAACGDKRLLCEAVCP